MRKVVLFAVNNGFASTVVGPLEVFAYTGGIWNYLTGTPLDLRFQVVVASIDGKPVTTHTGLVIQPDICIFDIEQADIILLTSCGEDIEAALDQNRAITPWLNQQYTQGATLGSICTGLALLAATGLLARKRASTHWGMVEILQKIYPLVKVEMDQIIIDHGQLITSGGGYAGNDLALHLVAKICGKQMAKQCANALLLETGRVSQVPFAGLQHHRMHQDEQIDKIQQWLDNHYQNNVNLDDLAKHHSMSPRNFKRRFKLASGNTPLIYLQKLRIEAAKNILETTHLQIDQVAYQVGYNNESHFRQLFKRYTLLTPTNYRSRYSAL